MSDKEIWLENQNKRAIKRIKSELLSKNPKKIVTIWGAGASVKSGIPGGTYILKKMQSDLKTIKDTDQFKKKLREEMQSDLKRQCDPKTIEDIGLFEKKFDEVYREAKMAITGEISNRGREFSFEYILSLYSRVYGYEGLHQWLKQYIPVGNGSSPPYFPTFAHEYCSHLANNGMLNYFISVNFDEILESALHDELGYNNFQVISSKSEFERLQNKKCDEWTDEYHTKPKCFVLKPHGTISRGLTLRHLPESVEDFEKEKKAVLSEVMKDALIIFLGFGNYNEDIWLLFGETYSRGLTDDIVIVGRETGSIKSIKDKLPGDRHTKKIYEFVGDVDEFFKEINKALSEDPGYRSHRQTPTRHYIRSLFFDLFSRKLAKVGDEKEYRRIHRELEKIPESWFDMRIYELELLIYLMKTRGLFVQTTTNEPIRIKKAFKKCLEWEELKDELRPPEVIDNILNTTDRIFDHADVKDRLGKITFEKRWCFLLVNETGYDLENKIKKLCKKTADEYCKHIFGELDKVLKNRKRENDHKENLDKFKKNLDDHFKEELAKNFEKLYTDYDVDITEREISAIMRFNSPETIESRKKFVYKTKELLKEWNKLEGNKIRVSAVSAGWLGKEINTLWEEGSLETESRDCEIDIVSNFDNFTRKGKHDPSTTFSYLNLINSILTLLEGVKCWNGLVINWYLYPSLEHHMSIFSKDKENNQEEYTGAIYFNRPGKRTSISPLYLKEKKDVEMLKNYFEKKLIENPNQKNWLDCENFMGLLFKAEIDENEIINITTNTPEEHVTTFFRQYILKLKSNNLNINLNP